MGEPLRGHEDVVRSVAISLDGKTAVSGSRDKSVRVWDAQSGAAVGGPLLGHARDVACVAVSADGRVVVSGSWDETIRVWDAESGAAIGNALSGHTSFVNCVAVSMDERRVVSGSFDRTVRVWDVERGFKSTNLAGRMMLWKISCWAQESDRLCTYLRKTVFGCGRGRRNCWR